MAMSCRELIVYNHHATLTRLLAQYNEHGRVDSLDSNNIMGSYGDDASSNGAEAAANGEVFAGCETATSVGSIALAAQEALAKGLTLEQSLRAQQEEAMHCLRIQRDGYTIRRNVTCPFCEQKVDARDTKTTITCLSEDCGKTLNKATGEVTSPRRPEGDHDTVNSVSTEVKETIKLQTGHTYHINGKPFRRELLLIVGGARVIYRDEAGNHIGGVQAEELDAVVTSQILGDLQAT
jgi:hypothetical protein